MSTSAQQIRNFSGPALLSYGFRPFFLFGAAWSGLALALWLSMLAGWAIVPTAMAPVDWHVHEMIYGFVPAVVAGFLLTAVPNWTGRLPIVGLPLALLFGTWVAGRIGVGVSTIIGVLPAALIDVSFLAMLGWVIGREIVAARNQRNLKVLVMVALLGIGNLIFHLEAHTQFGAGYGTRLGLAAVIGLIILIGGRIIPSFTRNWLARKSPGRLPAKFGPFDVAVSGISAASLAVWVALPSHELTGWLAVLACVTNVVRVARWAGERTGAEPLVLVLHVAYAFVPVGFALLAGAQFSPQEVPSSAAVHAWSAGAIGLMTLAVMTRASLGHTSQPLAASRSTTLMYLAVGVGAVLRIAAALGAVPELLHLLAGTAWIAGWLGFVAIYGPLLAKRRV